ncbi:zinc transporter 7 [Poecilia reticulata]|uniref:zinc transporter 7 n=1 Tax=Poecilia reticulata TaxID=8081 RepID=UPI0004A228A2|nr:PREDICTED: zinc transporter 7 [Poecilia reticulata]
MLPLSIKDDEYKPAKFNLLVKLSGWFRSILADKTSRNLFFFLCLNLSFAFVELTYGIWSNRGRSHTTLLPWLFKLCVKPASCFAGVLLHIIADTLGSIGVIISALLMQKYDLMIADPICSMLIALLIGVSVVPLLKESIGILMQRTPPSLDNALPECYQRVQQLQGVYNLQEPHFWTLCTDVYIGTLKLLVAPDADTRWILSQTHNIFTQVGVRQLYVQIDTAAM